MWRRGQPWKRRSIRRRAESLAPKIRALPRSGKVEVRDDTAYAGGGSFPDTALPTAVIAIRPEKIGDAALTERLRIGSPSVMARAQDGCVLLDLRTVFEGQEEGLVRAIGAAITASR